MRRSCWLYGVVQCRERSRSLGLVGLLGGLVVECGVRVRWEVWEAVVGIVGLGFGVRRWWAFGLVGVRWWWVVLARVLR